MHYKLDWYPYFLEELKAIITETIYNSRVELIRGKWELGKAITEKMDLFKRAGYKEKVVENIAKDLGVSAVGLYKCIQFYKKYPLQNFNQVLEKLPEGKNISWYKICKNILPEPREEKKEKEECMHEVLKCKKCGKEFKRDELLQEIEKIKEGIR